MERLDTNVCNVSTRDSPLYAIALVKYQSALTTSLFQEGSRPDNGVSQAAVPQLFLGNLLETRKKRQGKGAKKREGEKVLHSVQ